jgi:hypothetical protein
MHPQLNHRPPTRAAALLVSMVILLGTLVKANAEESVAERIEAVTPALRAATWAVDWWLPRHELTLKRIADGDVDLLMIGDSITHGWEKGFKNRLSGEEVWKHYYEHRKAVNLGYAGVRTENVLWRLQHGEVR